MSKIQAIKEYFEADENVILVGIHYRGTDYVRHLQKMYNKQVDVIYFFKAPYRKFAMILFLAIRPLQVLREGYDLFQNEVHQRHLYILLNRR